MMEIRLSPLGPVINQESKAQKAPYIYVYINISIKYPINGDNSTE
jgi:hypothetical protein